MHSIGNLHEAQVHLLPEEYHGLALFGKCIHRLPQELACCAPLFLAASLGVSIVWLHGRFIGI